MTDLYNISSLTVNGVYVNDISKFYCPHMDDEDNEKSLATVKCVKDAIAKNETLFDVIHHSNMMRDEMTFELSAFESNADYDTTYNIKVNSYPSYYYPEDALNQCTQQRVFVPSNIRYNYKHEIDDNYEKGYVSPPVGLHYQLKYQASDDVIYMYLDFDVTPSPGAILKLSDNFFGGVVSDDNVIFDDTEDLNDLFADEACTQSYSGYHEIKDEIVYFKPTSLIRKFNFKLTFDNLDRAIALFGQTQTNAKITVKDFNFRKIVINNPNIEELTFSSNLKYYAITIGEKQEFMIIDYPNCQISNVIDNGFSTLLRVSAPYYNQIKNIITNGPMYLYLAKGFFDDVIINSQTPSGFFGNFSCSDIVEIWIEPGINSDLEEKTLIVELRRILCFEGTIEIRDFIV